jgi:hypothetical protein
VASKAAGRNIKECLQPRNHLPYGSCCMDICGKADHLWTVGRLMSPWEGTGKGTMATHRGKGPGMLRRIRGDNVGKGQFPAGADSDLQRHLV